MTRSRWRNRLFKEGLAAVDWVGSLLIVGGTLMLLLGLEFGGIQFLWDSATILCLIVFGIAVIGLFMHYEANFVAYPIIPPHLFQSRMGSITGALAFLQALIFMSGNYWLPLYFQAVPVRRPYSQEYTYCHLSSQYPWHDNQGIWQLQDSDYLGFLVMTLGFGLFTDLGWELSWAKTSSSKSLLELESGLISRHR